jgi:hypothetical protein
MSRKMESGFYLLQRTVVDPNPSYAIFVFGRILQRINTSSIFRNMHLVDIHSSYHPCRQNKEGVLEKLYIK